MNPDKFLKLKSKVDQAKREKDRSEGALESLMTELQQEFNCQTLKAARIERDKLIEEETQLEKSAEEALHQLETDYPQLFEE